MGEAFSKSLKNGSLKAYNELFSTHYSKLFNYALKLSNNEDIAKDIVQEAFIKLWLHRENIKPDLSISNYLLKICHNEFLIHARKKKKEKAFLDQLKIETAYELFISTEQEPSRIEWLNEAINKLPPKCKEVFKLSKFEKMKYKAIAEKMEISIKTVENHVSKAYRELRKNLQHLSVLALICTLF